MYVGVMSACMSMYQVGSAHRDQKKILNSLRTGVTCG